MSRIKNMRVKDKKRFKGMNRIKSMGMKNVRRSRIKNMGAKDMNEECEKV